MKPVRTTITRLHDISCGHRVFGHEGACSRLHGHNYRVKMVCASLNNKLDDVGRVIDFSEIKDRLCKWLDDCWDHRFLVWCDDPLALKLQSLDHTVVVVPFNPTAENLAMHLVKVVAPERFVGTGVELVACEVQETRKCSAWYTI